MTAAARIAAVVGGLPAVSLDELTADAALLTRVDRKYVVPMSDAAALLDAIRPAEPHALDIAGERASSYRSVYFDTPDLLSYRLAAHGRRRRFKLRTRTYVDTDAAYLEMKTRGARGLTRKERDEYATADAGRLTPDARDEVAVALDAIGVAPERADDLDPVLQTLYRRTTLLVPDAAGDAPSRVTLDLDLAWVAAAGDGFMLPEYAIVETKSPGRVGIVDRSLWRLGHRPQRISKYATGLATLRPTLPRNRWARVLSGAFGSPCPVRTTTAHREDAT
ncbi:polyphosphate polymerase domain-containing protein [Microbacterium lacticum]